MIGILDLTNQCKHPKTMKMLKMMEMMKKAVHW